MWFNGTETAIHLPVTYFTEMLQQGDVAIYAKGGPDDSVDMNFMTTVSVRLSGREALRVDQKRGRLGSHQTLMDLAVDGAILDGGRRHASGAHGALRLNVTNDRLHVRHVPTGLEFVIASRPTTRRDAPDSHHLNLHFAEGLVTSGAGAAAGALPQLWGTQPLSPEVADLVHDRHREAEVRRRAAA